MRYREDPSIAAAARSAAAEMHDALVSRYGAGEHFWTAREAVIAEHGPKVSRECGKETAQRALAAITALGPENMPKQARRAAGAALLDEMEARYRDHHGPGYRFGPITRLWFSITGTVLAAPRRPRRCADPRLAGAELQAWRDKAAARRLAEARADLGHRDAKTERAAAGRAEARELESFLARHRRRLERGDMPRVVPPDEQDVRAFLRGQQPLTRRSS